MDTTRAYSKLAENFIKTQIKRKKEENRPLNAAEKEYLAIKSDWKKEWGKVRDSVYKHYRISSRSERINEAKNEVIKDKRADRALSYITTLSVDALKEAVYVSAKAQSETYQKVLNSLTKNEEYNFFINPDFVKMQNVILENGNVKQLLEAAKHPGTDIVALISKAYEVANVEGYDLNEVRRAIRKTFEFRCEGEAEFINIGCFKNYDFIYPTTSRFYNDYKPSVKEQIIESLKDYDKIGANSSSEGKNI